ncbi:hypothetical protein WJX84_011682 [Apatococcus fuscideae]|uniref:HMG box domain-containing protein n=1 Tax=Apatococcus fuscideae TaxID=2026836 RepID=A0AAW1SQ07_9CHLO
MVPARKTSLHPLFCSAQRAQLKEASPDASHLDITKGLATLWKAMSAEERQPYIKQHEEEEVALKAQKQSADHRAADATPVETSKDDSDHSTADKSSMLKPKAAMPTSTVKVNTRQQHSLPTEEDDEQLRMDVDWSANPAELVLAQTDHPTGAKLLVKRKGCSLEDYGLCDMATAKRQRLQGSDGTEASPVSLEMLEEWEAFQKSCKMAVFNGTEDGELDLDDLSENSPLKACAFLGKLREVHYPLNKITKRKHEQPDAMMRVPTLGLSFAVQRMLHSQTVEKDAVISDLKEKLLHMRGEMDVLQMTIDVAQANSAKAQLVTPEPEE